MLNMQQHIQLRMELQPRDKVEEFTAWKDLGACPARRIIRLVFILWLILSFQCCTMQHWSGIGTFSILEGCQWVFEPVSRHFFINQTAWKGIDYISLTDHGPNV